MPPRLTRGLAILVAVPFVAIACTTAAIDRTDGQDARDSRDSTAVTGSTAETRSTAEPSPADRTFLDIELTDARTGETFTLASLAGRPVAIEPMAIWCTNCKVQQDQVKAALPELEATGVRYISLGVEPNERADALAEYADRRDYPWTFVQSPIELSRALNDLFGPQVLSVPSTPLIVLDETGDVAYQDVGFHGPEALVDIIEGAAG